MSDGKQLTCFICLESKLQHVNVKVPLASGPIITENEDKNFTYLDCLRYCSKLEFRLDENEIPILCYRCADNLQETYNFLQQVHDAHERMLQTKETKLDEMEELLLPGVFIETDEDERLKTNFENEGGTTDASVAQTKLDDDCAKVDLPEFNEKCNRKMDFTCNLCNKKFKHLESFKYHGRHTHKMENSNFCKVCSTFISDGTKLREHIEAEHSNIVCCDECDYQCLEKSLAKHKMKSHSTLKQQQEHQTLQQIKESVLCSICGKNFACKSYLARHMKVVHSDNLEQRETYDCPQCSKKYATKGSLRLHMRLHNNKAFACTVCEKQIRSFAELKIHMRFHTGECPEICEVCGKKFKIKSHLRAHMWQHEGIKLQCDNCDKVFTSSKALKEHSFVHSVMPIKCRHCDKGYPSREKFKTHLKCVHHLELTNEELQENHLEPQPLLRTAAKLVKVDTQQSSTTKKTSKKRRKD